MSGAETKTVDIDEKYYLLSEVLNSNTWNKVSLIRVFTQVTINKFVGWYNTMKIYHIGYDIFGFLAPYF